MRTHHLNLFLTFTLVLLSALPMLAATQNATVYGTVYNASGNSEAGITVSLANPSLGFQRTTTTGSDGSYNFAEVPPAEGYVLTAMRGSQIIDIRSGIVVNVGDERVIFPPLREQVTVAAAKPVAKAAEAGGVQLETVATSISGVITGDQLRSLPLYNRNFLVLGGLTPNVHDLAASNDLAGASFSVNGQRGSSNNFLLDGADNVASTSNQAVPFQVNDAIQEFRVISAGAPAEYGRNSGGVVNVVTRRGSNAFHGSAFGYFANDALNSEGPLSVYTGSGFAKAASYAGSTSPALSLVPRTYNSYVATAQAFGYCTDGSTPGNTGVFPAPAACSPKFDPAAVMSGKDSRKQPFDSKQFGVNLGGPIVKDKLFAFGSYEATMIDNPNPIFERVPLPWDTTYAPFGAGFSPQFSPTDPNWTIAKNILSLYPAANVIAVPNALGFYQGEAPNWTDVHNFLVRTDWIKSEATNVSIRYALQRLNQLHDDTLPRQSTYPGNGIYRDVLNHNLSIGWSHSLSSHTINEARVGFNRFSLTETPQDSSFDPQSVGLDLSAMPLFQMSGIDPQLSGTYLNTPGAASGWTNWYYGPVAVNPIAPTLDNRFPFAHLGAPLGAPMGRTDTTIFGSDSVSWSLGKHTVKFGGEVRRQMNDLSNGAFSRGFILAGNVGEFTHDAESCNGAFGIACTGNGFLRPSYNYAEQGGPPYRGDFHNIALGAYIQDTWRIGSRVTLNYGLRYEFWTLPTEEHNALWNYNPAVPGLVKPDTNVIIDMFGNRCTGSGFASYPWRANPEYWGFVSSWGCNAPTATGLREAFHSFAPRLGLAWDVFGTGKTVLRWGGGMFYDQRPVSDVAQLMYNRPLAGPNGSFGEMLFADTAGVCSGLQCGLGNTLLNPAVQGLYTLGGAQPNSVYSAVYLPQAIYARDITHTAKPYSAQLDFTFQQQMSNNVALEVGYVGSRSENLPVIYNPNQVEELWYSGTGIAPHGNFDFTPIFTMTNQGESQYHSLMARLRVADWHGLRLDAAYAWSKSMDNASTTSFPTVPMSFTALAYGGWLTTYDLSAACVYGLGAFCSVIPSSFPDINFSGSAVTTTGANAPLVTPYLIPQSQSAFLSNDRGLSDFDVRHRFVLNYTWELPTKQWNWPKWANNWVLSGIFTAQSGQPFTIFSGPVMGEFTQRASASGPVHVSSNPNGAIDPTNLYSRFSTTCGGSFYVGAFLTPSECLGGTRRNQFIGPNYIDMDFAVQKGFQLGGEGRMLSFRAEFFNLFNRANFYNPISTLTLDGTNPNPDFGKIKSAHNPRQIQFAVRYTW